MSRRTAEAGQVHRFGRGRGRALVPAAVALVFVTAGTAWAAIPGSDSVIHGCHAADGQLRVIDAADGETCRPSEQALSWNQVGPIGPQGEPGVPGEQGSPGISGFERVTGPDNVQVAPATQPGRFAGSAALCPHGKEALGGGGFLGGPGVTTGQVRLYASQPVMVDGRSGWRAWAQQGAPTTDSWFIRSYATCAVVAE